MEVAIVMAFCADGMAGNGAGVAIVDDSTGDETLQAVAAEIGLSETAFLCPEGGDVWNLRWFTPTIEVSLCGHATLAAAHYLHRTNRAGETIRFRTRGGELTATMTGETIGLDLPEDAPTAVPLDARLRACIDTACDDAARNAENLCVRVADEAALRTLRPNLPAIAELDAIGLIVTTDRVAGADYAYRYFAPAVGIDEDPVTGSANCLLAAYWSARLRQDRFDTLQSSPAGGRMHVERRGGRVVVSGVARTVETRRITLPKTRRTA